MILTAEQVRDEARRGEHRTLRAVIGADAEGGGVPDDLCGNESVDRQDGSADRFRNLWEDRVSEAGKTGTANAASRSQRGGYPIIHSTKVRSAAVPPALSEDLSKPRRADFSRDATLAFIESNSSWFPLIARGVGKSCAKLGRTGPTLPACPLRFEPYGVFTGVGSNARSNSVWLTPLDRKPEHGRGVGMVKCLFGFPRTAWIKSPRPPLSASEARGVGNVIAEPEEPSALSEVVGAGMDSTHHERPAGVAESFHLSENPVRAASSEARHVLSSSPTGSDFSDDADVVEEQSRSLAVDTLPLRVGRAGVLAGRASDNDVWNKSICTKPVSCEGADIVVHPHAGIVVGEDSAPPRIGFARGDGLEPSAMQPQGPAASRAAEQVEHLHRWVPVGALARRIVRELAEMGALGGEDAGK